MVLAAVAVVLGMVPARPACAHASRIAVWVDDGKIVGGVYFTGRGVAVEAEVSVLAPDGEDLGKTTTNAKGEFVFVPSVACDHTFVVDFGDGHRCQETIPADRLPGAVAEHVHDVGPAVEDAPGGTVAPVTTPGTTAEICSQIRGLDEKLQRYQHKIMVHDILGGVGYIVGVFGMVCYLKCRRRAGREAKSNG